MQHDDAGGEQRSSHYAAEIRCGEALREPSANPGSSCLRQPDRYRDANRARIDNRASSRVSL
jgi:hypothetical protein